jgi:hypothetical protein
MRRRSLLLALAALLATTGAPAIAQTRDGPPSFSGTWNVSATGPRFRSGTYSFQQLDQSVIGANPAGGQMHGKLKDANNVEGTWIGPSGATGWFKMHMASDRKSFTGEYGSRGLPPTGTLVGRLRSASPGPS